MIRLLGKLLGKLFGKADGSLGQRGEKLASDWLRKQGYQILDRNLPMGDDEADLVALDPDQRTVVIVEVKTRQARDADDIIASTPELAVTRTKQYHIARLAARLQQSKKYEDHAFRFDVVAVVVHGDAEPLVRHIPGAFQSPW
jgi:putative endonuclease